MAVLASVVSAADESRPLYQNDFSKTSLGPLPEAEFLVLDGAFEVREEGGNKFVELPGAPLDTFGVLFGPTQKSEVSVSARFFGTKQGRRFPTFGVGLNGVGSYRLQVAPAKKTLDLYKGDDVKASGSFDWESDKWTVLRLQVRKAKEGQWLIEGKAWSHGAPEPTKWVVSLEETSEPAPGRASLWGSPFSGTPIRFDDLVVSHVNDGDSK